MPATFPCSVTVVDRGRPIADAVVILSPQRELRSISVNGTTSVSGVATVRTTRLGARYAEAGAPAGLYQVSVEKLPPWDGAKTSEEVSRMTESERQAYAAAYTTAMETLPREVPKSLSFDKNLPIEVVDGKGGVLTIDVAQVQGQ